MFHSVTGTLLKSEEDSETARKLIAEGLGISEEQAKYELSRNYRVDSGTRAIFSWSFGDDGPLCIDLYFEPSYRSPYFGSFPASRVAERSEAPEFDL